MKKMFAVLLTLALMLSMAACGSGTAATATTAAAAAPEAATSDTTAASAEPIRIGVVSTFSGSNSGHGQYCKEGVELWLDDVNANGGILGRPVKSFMKTTARPTRNTRMRLLKFSATATPIRSPWSAPM